jgi:hypothetical protein
MTFDQVLSLAFQRADQLQNYWAFYATLVLALLAFFASTKSEQRTVTLAAIITIAFLAVSVANLEAVLDVTRQRLELQSSLVSAAADNQELLRLARTITPSSTQAVTIFHAIFDAFTLVAIWTMALMPTGDR